MDSQRRYSFPLSVTTGMLYVSLQAFDFVPSLSVSDFSVSFEQGSWFRSIRDFFSVFPPFLGTDANFLSATFLG